MVVTGDPLGQLEAGNAFGVAILRNDSGGFQGSKRSIQRGEGDLSRHCLVQLCGRDRTSRVGQRLEYEPSSLGEAEVLVGEELCGAIDEACVHGAK